MFYVGPQLEEGREVKPKCIGILARLSVGCDTVHSPWSSVEGKVVSVLTQSIGSKDYTRHI
ncbi:hypothetical protein GCM10010129_82410 [Streptomyces fumigatiscleroticus]|nr:hypothetical protein GCM10010129_82410 [Streptomyces fumigatiscleroticus]